MANYKNSLGESELFGRMTAGFAKICESVQSGKFVRDEMGVICESVCEDDENAGAAPEGETADAGTEGVTADAGTEGATQDADVASATPEQINGSVNEGEKLTRGAVDAVVKSGSDNALTNSGDAPDGWTVLDAEGKTVVDFGTLDDVVAGAIEKGVEFDVDEDMLPKFRKWYDALEEAKVVGEGIVGKTLGTIGGATVGSAIGGALGCPVAGGIAGGIAGASLTEGCDGKNKKPMKKLIPEGCCGGKAKKVLKKCGSTVVTEKKVPLCKTCGNPLDETGTCQDCQGYSEVKEGEGEIKLQIPAELKRKAALKANAQANKEKVAQAIRDGKAVGIVKEGLDDRKGADKITKDVVFGMLVNLLYQLRDGASVEEVTANPDMEEFDDYTLDEVLELAKKYEV